MNRLIIFGTCSAAVSALVIGISVLSDPVFKLEIDPALQNHFSNDKEAWWKELPVEVLPTRSGVYNHESWENEKEALGLLVLGRSTLGDLPIVEVSHSKKGVVEISLSKETVDCGTKTETTSDEVRLKHRGFADIDDDGVELEIVYKNNESVSSLKMIWGGPRVAARIQMYIAVESYEEEKKYDDPFIDQFFVLNSSSDKIQITFETYEPLIADEDLRTLLNP